MQKENLQGNVALLEGKNAAEPKDKKGYLIAKRVMDVVCAFFALIILSPILFLIAIAIRIDSPGPAVFRHRRVGQNGTPLYLYKFRSMFQNAESMIKDFTPEQKAEWEKNFKLEHDPRITRVGNFLRKTSLDELPQLINIIQGNLSIVGPRPVTQQEVDMYGDERNKFLSVKPGLTGYWQAYARSEVDYGTRQEMELYYVDHANFWWDVKIIFATVGAVLKCRGAQ